MRILTRGDFDGLISSVLLTDAEQVREIRFAHPKDAQDGKVEATDQDIVVNMPFIPGCGLWFDHHVSEVKKTEEMGDFKGRFEMAPSCARVIYNHYGAETFRNLRDLENMLDAADRLDAARLTMEDITEPEGWVLLGLTLDPRTGLGPEFRKYFRWLVEYVKELPITKVLQHPEVKRRCDRVLTEQEEFKGILQQASRQDGNVIVTDLRGKRDLPVGNRFLVYTMFPDANVEVRLFDGYQGCTVVAAGHSIFNRTCEVSCGKLLARYGGGGHSGAATAQLHGEPEERERQIGEIIEAFKQNRPLD
jgi:hypothetical protein